MTDCATCAEEIEPRDQLTVRRFPEGPNPDAEEVARSVSRGGCYVHLACTDDGTKRWLRAGRPADDPLSWVRQNGLNWTGLAGGGFDARTVIDFL